MKSHLRTLLPVLLLAATVSHAHVGDVVYPIYELPTADLPDLHDGSLEDWEAALPNASLNQNDFVYSEGLGGVIDPADLAWRIFLAWHHKTQRIYMAVERLDDVYLPPCGERCFGEGPTTLSVDADHSGGQYFLFTEEDGYSVEQSKRLGNASAQSYSIYPEPPFGDQLLTGGGWAHAWVTLPPWSDWGGIQLGESPNYSIMEFYITPFDDLNWEGPELSRRSSLEPGMIMGFQISVSDSDDRGRSQGWYLLALPTFDTTGQPITWAQNFVDGELIPCHIGDCSQSNGTAIVADSWGRIKASLR